MKGIVVDYNDLAGFGHVQSDGDGEFIFFHCTAIAASPRAIKPKAPVTFDRVSSHRVGVEATNIVLAV